MMAATEAPVLWTAAEAAAATDGMAAGDAWQATGVSIDSRTCQPGDLFIALKGPRFDGHDYAADALARGACAIMVHRPPPNVAADAPLLVVEDTMEGLESLATAARLRSNAQVAAITGSVGKTGTKEALRTVLSAQGLTHATQGNLNNQWGVPLSLARLPRQARFGVFELGMNSPGEIAPLSRLVKPDVAIITTVEAVHIEFFESEEGIADEKASIFAGMGPTGVAILNRDNRHFARLVAHARTQGIARIWSFGDHASADARLIDCSLHATASAVAASIRGQELQYSLPLPGKHHVINSLAVLLAVKALGADTVTAARSLARLAPGEGRGARTPLQIAGGPILLIDESYNASPVAVASALAVLGKAEIPGAYKGPQRRIAVLGDMLELGVHAEAMHRDLAKDAVGAGIDLVFACGPHMRALYDALPPALQGGYADDSDALAAQVAVAVRPGDVLMVKGSLGSRMAKVVAALQALTETEAPAPRAANGS
jgi:UDP-N-acetylmuramoyl-tripeptide--D-alanyl-D-alanine ligase